jgi:hypothetical protein
MNKLKRVLNDADPLQHELQPSSGQRDALRRAVIACASDARPDGLVMRRWIFRSAIVLILGAIFLFAATRPQYAAVKFEVRLAETAPAPGLKEAKLAGTERRVYLHGETVVSNEDVARAELIPGDTSSQFFISIIFNETGARKMRAATEGHIGRPVAVLIDDEVVIAPAIRSIIDGAAVINGNYSKERAERIVNGIALR